MTKPLAMSLDTVAARLDIGRRWLLEWLWRNPADANGTPYYRKAGRTKLFTETDVARILAALPAPEAPRCPSSSSRRGHPTRTMRSAAATSTSSDYIALRELLKNASPNKRSESSGGTSKVVPLRQRQARPSPARP